MSTESKFAGGRKAFLARNYPAVYAEMEKTGELEAHLDQVGRNAKAMYDQIVNRYKAEIEAIGDPGQKLARLGQIERMAEELVLNEVILTL